MWKQSWFEDLFQDVRYAFRQMWRAPGFTAVAVLTMGLGIGSNTAIFSVVDKVLLQPLPYPNPDRLVVLLTTAPQGSAIVASPTKFNVWRRQTTVLEDVSAYRFSVLNVTEGTPEQIRTGHTSADFHRLLGAPMLMGRAFLPEEDLPGGNRVVVLSEGFWKRRFGGDPMIVGRTLSLNGEPYEVIGVVGRFSAGDAGRNESGPTEAWIPFQIDPNSTMQGHFFTVAARLKPGVTLAAANAHLQLASNEFRERFPNAMPPQFSFG